MPSHSYSLSLFSQPPLDSPQTPKLEHGTHTRSLSHQTISSNRLVQRGSEQYHPLHMTPTASLQHSSSATASQTLRPGLPPLALALPLLMLFICSLMLVTLELSSALQHGSSLTQTLIGSPLCSALSRSSSPPGLQLFDSHQVRYQPLHPAATDAKQTLQPYTGDSVVMDDESSEEWYENLGVDLANHIYEHNAEARRQYHAQRAEQENRHEYVAHHMHHSHHQHHPHHQYQYHHYQPLHSEQHTEHYHQQQLPAHHHQQQILAQQQQARMLAQMQAQQQQQQWQVDAAQSLAVPAVGSEPLAPASVPDVAPVPVAPPTPTPSPSISAPSRSVQSTATSAAVDTATLMPRVQQLPLPRKPSMSLVSRLYCQALYLPLRLLAYAIIAMHFVLTAVTPIWLFRVGVKSPLLLLSWMVTVLLFGIGSFVQVVEVNHRMMRKRAM